jgi:hypothetical protein
MHMPVVRSLQLLHDAHCHMMILVAQLAIVCDGPVLDGLCVLQPGDPAAMVAATAAGPAAPVVHSSCPTRSNRSRVNAIELARCKFAGGLLVPV